MPTVTAPSISETIRSLKLSSADITPAQAKAHLENLIYITSVLYMDDKKNPKHQRRTEEVIIAMEEQFKTEIDKEIGSAQQYKGDVYLVAQILAINKIIDKGMTRMRAIIEASTADKGVPVKTSSSSLLTEKAKSDLAASQPGKDNPKLRETLSFLLSVVGDPSKLHAIIPLHIPNLDKISRLIRQKPQDPKMIKLKASLVGVLAKIYENHNEHELLIYLNNTLKVLRNITQYQAVVTEFENTIKHFMVSPASSPAEMSQSIHEQSEKFYKNFKDDKNIMKRIAMADMVMTSAAFKYNKELTAACVKFKEGLRRMGLMLA